MPGPYGGGCLTHRRQTELPAEAGVGGGFGQKHTRVSYVWDGDRRGGLCKGCWLWARRVPFSLPPGPCSAFFPVSAALSCGCAAELRPKQRSGADTCHPQSGPKDFCSTLLSFPQPADQKSALGDLPEGVEGGEALSLDLQ